MQFILLYCIIIDFELVTLMFLKYFHVLLFYWFDWSYCMNLIMFLANPREPLWQAEKNHIFSAIQQYRCLNLRKCSISAPDMLPCGKTNELPTRFQHQLYIYCARKPAHGKTPHFFLFSPYICVFMEKKIKTTAAIFSIYYMTGGTRT